MTGQPDYEEIARLERELGMPAAADTPAAAAADTPAAPPLLRLGRRRCKACGNTWPSGLEACNHCNSAEWWVDENG
jgi:hypothetical protein